MNGEKEAALAAWSERYPNAPQSSMKFLYLDGWEDAVRWIEANNIVRPNTKYAWESHL